ncbi:MAG: 2-oxoglutarate dehydrogenase complex dihydrolipoyllysine-residue succinyltransferase [Bacilli bacterium]
MVEVIVPELGESIREGSILRWLKQQGDEVQEGDILLELETDKVNLEIIAESSGVLQDVRRQVGDTVAVGEVLAAIAAKGSQPQAGTGEHKPVESAPEPARAPRAAAQPLRATPSMRRMARSAGNGHGRVQGMREAEGERGEASVQDMDRITAESVDRGAPTAPSSVHVAPSTTAASATSSEPVAAVAAATPQPRAGLHADGQKTAADMEQVRADETPVRMSRRRLTIARRLVEAQHTAAMLTTFNEVDMTAILDMRKRRRDRFREEHGVGLGFTSFFTKAVVGALRAFPALNAEIRGEDMILKQHYDIGIAVSTEKGLIVPVLRDADRLSFAGVEGEIARLAQRVRDDALTLGELQGGTFTITNGGVFGSLLSTPILNAPQVGILGMHKIQERPVAVHGEVLVRPMMYIALSYDHRIVDGSEAVRFLVKVKDLAEDPESLLFE